MLLVAAALSLACLPQIPIKVLRGHTDTVSSCQLALNDQKLVTSSYDKTAILWVRLAAGT